MIFFYVVIVIIYLCLRNVFVGVLLFLTVSGFGCGIVVVRPVVIGLFYVRMLSTFIAIFFCGSMCSTTKNEIYHSP